jgi:hypothetical protein
MWGEEKGYEVATLWETVRIFDKGLGNGEYFSNNSVSEAR